MVTYPCCLEYLNGVPLSVVKCWLGDHLGIVHTSEGGFPLPRPQVDSQHWVSIYKLHRYEIPMVGVHNGTVVQEQPVSFGGGKLELESTVFTLGKWLVPRPSVTTETVLQLLALCPIKTSRTLTTENKTFKFQKQFNFRKNLILKLG